MRIVAAGKAATAMVAAFLSHSALPPEWDVRGVLIAPRAWSELPRNFQYFQGGHPIPDEASFQGARAALRLLQGISAEDVASTLCIFLLSGGASAMMEMPLDPAISLADTQAFHGALVGSGASITEINCVRKHFSAVKGGRLRLAAAGATCLSMFVSDVPAGQEDAIGSGPTLEDTSTAADCRAILERYSLLAQFPAAVRSFFGRSELPGTPRNPPGQARSHVLLHADDLTEAAARRATELGCNAVIDHTCDEWEYDKAAEYLMHRLRELRQRGIKVCLIAGGEVLVRLPTAAAERPTGTGGRNQHFALYAATRITPEDGQVAILSAGSDGIDGNSPAAGAVVDATLLQEDGSRILAEAALRDFDSHPFLAARGAALVTGTTGNNLRDLRMLLSA